MGMQVRQNYRCGVCGYSKWETVTVTRDWQFPKSALEKFLQSQQERIRAESDARTLVVRRALEDIARAQREKPKEVTP